MDLITDLDERIALIGAAGVDDLVVLDFDESLSRVEYDRFVQELLVDRLGYRRGSRRWEPLSSDLSGFAPGAAAGISGTAMVGPVPGTGSRSRAGLERPIRWERFGARAAKR